MKPSELGLALCHAYMLIDPEHLGLRRLGEFPGRVRSLEIGRAPKGKDESLPFSSIFRGEHDSFREGYFFLVGTKVEVGFFVVFLPSF